MLEINFSCNRKIEESVIPVLQTSLPISINISTLKPSKWKTNQLVVIPAIWKEIDWYNRSSWPLWLREGLNLTNNPLPSYHVHLYQRIDPNSTYPYDWPYCANVHEEAGLYLKFIYEYYHDLPDKMLFIQGDVHVHSPYPIETVQCIRDDVHYASINFFWNIERPWSFWPRDPTDNIGLMYKCAVRLLHLFGFNGRAQLNPEGKTPRDDNVVTAICCAQFYVTKQRIHHYTYKQWASLYRASLQPYCTTELDRETPGKKGIKWFGGSFEHLWHVILGLYATDMPAQIPGTNTDPCHLFYPSCKGSPCSDN
ncbi:unnamed protein product [Adineta steineri]|uniref:Uncharacterized protein n=1 Tax=Adineta steineri TaxID=433720 RepID=A0A815MMV7_9BILA|nr:unnamed protein product [Adineta steineri]CAF1621500.1 unnamed protein product [Adineta steineri]